MGFREWMFQNELIGVGCLLQAAVGLCWWHSFPFIGWSLYNGESLDLGSRATSAPGRFTRLLRLLLLSTDGAVDDDVKLWWCLFAVLYFFHTDFGAVAGAMHLSLSSQQRCQQRDSPFLSTVAGGENFDGDDGKGDGDCWWARMKLMR